MAPRTRKAIFRSGAWFDLGTKLEQFAVNSGQEVFARSDACCFQLHFRPWKRSISRMGSRQSRMRPSTVRRVNSTGKRACLIEGHAGIAAVLEAQPGHLDAASVGRGDIAEGLRGIAVGALLRPGDQRQVDAVRRDKLLPSKVPIAWVPSPAQKTQRLLSASPSTGSSNISQQSNPRGMSKRLISFHCFRSGEEKNANR